MPLKINLETNLTSWVGSRPVMESIEIEISTFRNFQDFLNFFYTNIISNKNLIGNVSVKQNTYGYAWCFMNNGEEITKYNNKSFHLMNSKINEVNLMLNANELSQETLLRKEVSMWAEFNINFASQNPEYGAIWNCDASELEILKDKHNKLYTINRTAYNFAVDIIQNRGIITNYFDKIEINHLENDKLDLLLIDKDKNKFYIVKLNKLSNGGFECLNICER